MNPFAVLETTSNSPLEKLAKAKTYSLSETERNTSIDVKDSGRSECKGEDNRIESKSVLPQKGGTWSDADNPGNGEWKFDPEYRPKNKTYNNLENKTIKEMGEDLGDDSPSVKYENGEPIFDKDPGAKEGKPYEVEFENGIGEYLNDDEINAKNGRNINRESLHEEFYERLANQLDVSVDEVKVFKGDSAAADRLSNEWGCATEEVWSRCDNPNHVQRVPHECPDKKTVQLVPRLYHDHVAHVGGVEAYSSEVLEKK